MWNLRSKLRRELFAYYFTNPGAGHHLRELAGLLDADPGNLSRELSRLENQGLFSSERRGRQKYFYLNRRYPLYEELRRIVFKTVGAVGKLRDELEQIRGIREAHLYGSFARDQQDAASDIDLLIIGKPNAEELEEIVRKLERRLHRELNYTVMSPEEFKARRAAKDAFLADIWKHARISLIGSP